MFKSFIELTASLSVFCWLPWLLLLCFANCCQKEPGIHIQTGDFSSEKAYMEDWLIANYF